MLCLNVVVAVADLRGRSEALLRDGGSEEEHSAGCHQYPAAAWQEGLLLGSGITCRVDHPGAHVDEDWWPGGGGLQQSRQVCDTVLWP